RRCGKGFPVYAGSTPNAIRERAQLRSLTLYQTMNTLGFSKKKQGCCLYNQAMDFDCILNSMFASARFSLLIVPLVVLFLV
ncbi:MAG: hypothetical protein ACI9SY_000389, partial [Candidatus Paceibacteria bacterium]